MIFMVGTSRLQGENKEVSPIETHTHSHFVIVVVGLFMNIVYKHNLIH